MPGQLTTTIINFRASEAFQVISRFPWNASLPILCKSPCLFKTHGELAWQLIKLIRSFTF